MTVTAKVSMSPPTAVNGTHRDERTLSVTMDKKSVGRPVEDEAGVKDVQHMGGLELDTIPIDGGENITDEVQVDVNDSDMNT